MTEINRSQQARRSQARKKKKSSRAVPNELLKEARTLRGWSQSDVAEKINASSQAVSKWELGKAHPTPRLCQDLCRLFEKSVTELGLVKQEAKNERKKPPAQSPSTTEHRTPLYGNMPGIRNPCFTGHEQTLQTLHTALIADKKVSLMQALSGLGGIGKTQLALEYAYRYRENYKFVLWLGADSEEILFSGMIRIAQSLGIAVQDGENQHQVSYAVKRWLNINTDWLLIVDNVEDPVLLNNILPQENSTNGHVVFTTRTQAVGAWAHKIIVETMEEIEGATLLLRRANKIRLYDMLNAATVVDQNQARVITKMMGGLPLALDQAGAYIEETMGSVQEYFDLYQAQRSILLQRRGNPISGHPESVTVTFALAFKKVEQINQAAAELLQFCAFLHPDAIPEELITTCVVHLGPLLQSIATDPNQLNEALGVLFKYSLLHRNVDEKTLSMHRLVQEVLIDAMEEKARQEWAERTVQSFSRACTTTGSLALSERYMSHAIKVTELVETWKMQSEEAASLLYQTSYTLRERGLYRQAQPLGFQALRIYSALSGSEDLKVADAFINLAHLNMHLGMYDVAELIYEQALMLYEKVLGPDHPDMAEILDYVARMYIQRRRFDLATSYSKRARSIYYRMQVLKSPELAICLTTLGRIFYHKGWIGRYDHTAKDWYALAEQYHQHAKAMREELLGPDHLDVAESLAELAILATARNNMPYAKQFIERAIAIREKILGPDHPDTAHALEIQAIIFNELDYKELAEKSHLRVLSIRKQKLAPDHPDIGRSHKHLADLYQHVNKKREAEQHNQEARRIFGEQVELPPGKTLFELEKYLDSALKQMGREDAVVLLKEWSSFIRSTREKQGLPPESDTE